MKTIQLGRSDTQVSEICLGSMTWGTQNTYQEAAEQIECALDYGVNFIDTAEMYPTTPLTEKTLGDTEAIIGEWFAKSGRRSDVVLATKVTGNGREWIYGGQDIRLTELDKQVKAGKIRHIGLSNESCWGTAQFLSIAEANGLPRVVSIQNEYNLMNRLYDLDLAELSHHEDVGLLAFSPLAAGMLSGKYSDGQIPAGSRRSMNDKLGGRYSDKSEPVCNRYVNLAKAHGVDPAQMALAFCLLRPFMASVIIGATTMDQLKVNLSSTELVLSDELKQGIQEIYTDHPVPM